MDIQIFNSESFCEVRTLTNDKGENWFVLADVLAALGSTTRPAHAKKCIVDVLGKDVFGACTTKDTLGRTQKATTISEDATIYLLMTARTNMAKEARVKMVSQISGLKAILQSLKDFEVPEDLTDMFVYAIREEDTGNIKLGISRNPEARLKQLQTGNSSKLTLVGYREAKNKFKDEKALHQRNEALRIHGEWFSNEAQNTIHA